MELFCGKLAHRARAFFTCRLDDCGDPDRARKAILLNAIYAISLVFASAYGVYTARSGHTLIAVIDFTMIGVILASAHWLHSTRNISVASLLCVGTMGLFFLLLFLSGGVDNSGYLWSFCYPPMVLYLTGARRGLLISLMYFSVLLASVYLPGFPFIFADYQAIALGRFFGSFAAIVTVSWLYELARDDSYRRSNEQNRRLSEALEDLGTATSLVEESQKRLHDIMLSTSDVIWETDAQGRYRYVGGRAHEVLGYTCNELLGRSVYELEPEKDRGMRSLLEGSEGPAPSFQLTRSLLARGGERVCVLTTGVAYFHGETFLGLRGVDKDVTEQLRAEQERERLRIKVASAQKMEAVGQLAGGIAHDFNNILGAISGYADMIRLRTAREMPKAASYAETILAAATRASNLTSKLLAFARKGHAQQVLVDMHHLVADLIPLLKASFDKRIAVSFHPRAPRSCVNADASQMHEVLMTLALNARDAMPNGGSLVFETATVELDAPFIEGHQYECEPGQFLVIRVGDNGEGMSAEVREHLFEPFFTTKDQGQASGMGLASAYGIIRSHGGVISICSEPGLGTTVKLYLPALGVPDGTPVRKRPAAAIGSVRVLVVDDEQFMLGICSEMLNAMGFESRGFDNGSDAAAYFERNAHEIDLVLVDMNMTDMTGEAFLRKVRKHSTKMPVVLSSGFPLTEERERFLATGFSGVIQKPFTLSQLEEVIGEVLSA